MLSNVPFTHNATKRLIIGIGDLFNNIQIERKNSSNNTVQRITVPIKYGSREYFLDKLLHKKDMQIVLPQMSMEIVALTYDPPRKLSTVNKYVNLKAGDPDTLQHHYAPVPYNVMIMVTAMSRNMDDGLQIMEQILPYFTPEYNLPLVELPDSTNQTRDVTLILDGVEMAAEYEGDMGTEADRVFTIVFNFTAKMYFYGPVIEQGIIRKSIAHIYTNVAMNATSSYEDTTSTVLANADIRVNVTASPATANANSNYEYVTVFTRSPNAN